MISDNDLDRLLATLDAGLAPERLRAVRRSILTSTDAKSAAPFSLFGFRPALFAATALLGLVLGVSLPMLSADDGVSGLFDLPSQSFLGGSFG